MELIVIPIVIIGLIWALAIKSGGWMHDTDERMREITREWIEGRK